MFRYHYAAQCSIDAPQEVVWRALYDLNSYPEWNPFTVKIETSWQIGSPVILTVRMRPDRSPVIQKEKLKKLHPPHEIRWGMKWGVFLHAERVQQLKESDDGHTAYFTEDVIRGPLSPLVNLLYGRYIQQGFNGVASSLQKYVENQ